MTTTVHKSTAEAGLQITRDSYHWGATLGAAAGPISFSFLTTAASYTVSGHNLTQFSTLSSAEQTAARLALSLWASVANITFTDLGNSNSAAIKFANYRDPSDGSEAFAFYPSSGNTSSSSSQGDVFINTAFASTSNDSPGTYEFLTFVHEIGHALGLEHPGAYNAAPGVSITYQNNAEYVEDSYQYTVMSYFGETATGANYHGVRPETPMLDDIAAIQRLYGANMTTRTGNTTYGFNSNAGTPYSITSASQSVVFAVWDAGGSDTFDFSGYSQNQSINLNQDSFSNVGGLIGNVAIAHGVTIETAIGGSGNDTITGNAGDNILKGGLGDDVIDGGAGIDSAVFSGLYVSYTLRALSATGLIVSGHDGTDTLWNIEKLVFDDQTVNWNFTSAPARAAWNDFNGDGNSDLLWQNSDGSTAVWLLSGTSLIAGSNVGINAGPGWHQKDAGDFNGDGKSDILWQNDDGTPAVWLMNGLSATASQNAGFNPGPSWHVIAAADFNGDGMADILWQNADGTPAIWLMNGTSVVSGGSLGNPGPSWHVIGGGDFNGDGKADILWQNNDGQAAVWLMNGLNLISGSNVGTSPGAAWQVQAAGDFNGDGKADILWQNTNGQVAIWETDGQTVLVGNNVGFNPGPAWQVHGAADFNGDGKADIEWQNTDGTPAVWLMDGFNIVSGANVAFDPGAAWHLTPGHDVLA